MLHGLEHGVAVLLLLRVVSEAGLAEVLRASQSHTKTPGESQSKPGIEMVNPQNHVKKGLPRIM